MTTGRINQVTTLEGRQKTDSAPPTGGRVYVTGTFPQKCVHRGIGNKAATNSTMPPLKPALKTPWAGVRKATESSNSMLGKADRQTKQLPNDSIGHMEADFPTIAHPMATSQSRNPGLNLTPHQAQNINPIPKSATSQI
jgi:hypothetical protein